MRSRGVSRAIGGRRGVSQRPLCWTPGPRDPSIDLKSSLYAVSATTKPHT